jgi:DNA invertase Pin-like site-specific DNA recombinase
LGDRQASRRHGIYDEGHASTTAAAGSELSLESRSVMQTLLAELAVVQPTYLVCRDQDRLHRSSLEWELLQHQMVKAGVEAVVQWPNLQGAPIITRLSESKDRAFASIQAAFASLQKARNLTHRLQRYRSSGALRPDSRLLMWRRSSVESISSTAGSTCATVTIC